MLRQVGAPASPTPASARRHSASARGRSRHPRRAPLLASRAAVPRETPLSVPETTHRVASRTECGFSRAPPDAATGFDERPTDDRLREAPPQVVRHGDHPPMRRPGLCAAAAAATMSGCRDPCSFTRSTHRRLPFVAVPTSSGRDCTRTPRCCGSAPACTSIAPVGGSSPRGTATSSASTPSRASIRTPCSRTSRRRRCSACRSSASPATSTSTILGAHGAADSATSAYTPAPTIARSSAATASASPHRRIRPST